MVGRWKSRNFLISVSHSMSFSALSRLIISHSFHRNESFICTSKSFLHKNQVVPSPFIMFSTALIKSNQCGGFSYIFSLLLVAGDFLVFYLMRPSSLVLLYRLKNLPISSLLFAKQSYNPDLPFHPIILYIYEFFYLQQKTSEKSWMLLAFGILYYTTACLTGSQAICWKLSEIGNF